MWLLNSAQRPTRCARIWRVQEDQGVPPTRDQRHIDDGVQVISQPPVGRVQLLLHDEGQVTLLPLGVQVAQPALREDPSQASNDQQWSCIGVNSQDTCLPAHLS